MSPLRGLIAAVLIGAVLPAAATPPVLELGGGVSVVAGRFVPGAQPDGNSIVIEGRDGLIVFDTGRHVAHTQAIADLVQRRGKPLQFIVNSHWHLDHVGGNVLLRQRYPAVRVLASDATLAAQDDFLANYRSQLKAMLETGIDAAQRSAYETEIALIDARQKLVPDEILANPAVRKLAGREVQLGIVRGAATAADVWLFDVTTKTLASGDLVTLPVPLLDTACPQGFARGLDALGEVDFAVLVPGHGAPMRRAQFERYRDAYRNLLDCAASNRSNDQCGAAWLKDTGDLVPETEHAFALRLMDYYLTQNLRPNPARADGACT